MLKPKKKITRKELKQDTLVSTYAQLTSFYYENKQYVSYALTALVAIAIVLVVIMNNRRANDEKAATELGKVFALYDNGSTDPREYQAAVDGQPERGIKGLRWIVDNCGGSQSGEIARFYLANAYFNLGRIADAQREFDAFSGGDKLMKASAFAGLGSCFEAQRSYDKAASYYEKAANAVSNETETPEYLHFAAVCYGRSGAKDKAIALFKRLKKEYPSSTFAREADRYIAEFSA